MSINKFFTFLLCAGFDEPSQPTHDMNDHFKASVVAFEVQKSFASKFFSNKTVAKSLIDDTSARLLDNLYLLLKVFVSFKQYGIATVPKLR